MSETTKITGVEVTCENSPAIEFDGSQFKFMPQGGREKVALFADRAIAISDATTADDATSKFNKLLEHLRLLGILLT